MDPSLRLSCEELLEMPYFQEEGANWGRESERPGRRHDKGSRRRQPGVSDLEGQFLLLPPGFPMKRHLSQFLSLSSSL